MGIEFYGITRAHVAQPLILVVMWYFSMYEYVGYGAVGEAGQFVKHYYVWSSVCLQWNSIHRVKITLK